MQFPLSSTDDLRSRRVMMNEWHLLGIAISGSALSVTQLTLEHQSASFRTRFVLQLPSSGIQVHCDVCRTIIGISSSVSIIASLCGFRYKEYAKLEIKSSTKSSPYFAMRNYSLPTIQCAATVDYTDQETSSASEICPFGRSAYSVPCSLAGEGTCRADDTSTSAKRPCYFLVCNARVCIIVMAVSSRGWRVKRSSDRSMSGFGFLDNLTIQLPFALVQCVVSELILRRNSSIEFNALRISNIQVFVWRYSGFGNFETPVLRTLLSTSIAYSKSSLL